MSFFIGAGVILTQGDKYVLVREVRHEKQGFYNLPAGTLDVDEDIMTCVLREAAEETGTEVRLEHFVGVYQTVLADGNNIVFFIFAGSVPAGAAFHSEEHAEIECLSYDELAAYDQAGKLRAPTVLKSIDDYRGGQRLPLDAVQAWHLESLATITVEKDH